MSNQSKNYCFELFNFSEIENALQKKISGDKFEHDGTVIIDLKEYMKSKPGVRTMTVRYI